MRVRASSGVFSVGAGNKDCRIGSGLDIETPTESLSYSWIMPRRKGVCIRVHSSICLSVHPEDEVGVGHKSGDMGNLAQVLWKNVCAFNR